MFEFVMALVLTHSFATPSKPSCSARELLGQDCRLALGTYKIRLLSETIARDDGTWHTVDPMPLKGEGVTWEKVIFEIQQGLPLLQLWVWDAGAGEARVQALHWFVTDARKGTLKILSEGVVRRRRLRPVEEPVADPNLKSDAKAPLKQKPSFIYDDWEKHSAKITKDGKVEWRLGPTLKTLDPGAAVAEAKPSPGKTEETRKGH